MEYTGDAVATDGDPVADASPDATVAVGDTVCVGEPEADAVADGDWD